MRLALRAARATLWHGRALRRWMAVVFELQSRGVIRDLPGEYLRAVRPYVHRPTGVGARVVQLIDHVDWMETAFERQAFEQLASGQPLVLAELPARRGYEYIRLQLRRTASQSPEGELLLTLTVLRAPEVQQKAKPMDLAALGFSRFRVAGAACLVIGGVRGQRHAALRLSPVEVNQALHGWNPAVLMVRVAQELARFWGLHLLGLDPRSHQLQGWTYRLNKRSRISAQRLCESYEALWRHFEAKPGPDGWVVLPLNSDEKLASVALSPEKRVRQIRRADYWIRTRNLLRANLRRLLKRPSIEARTSRVTEAMTLDGADDDQPFQSGEDLVPSHILETGPGSLV